MTISQISWDEGYVFPLGILINLHCLLRIFACVISGEFDRL
jgi:hypothetical protein